MSAIKYKVAHYSECKATLFGDIAPGTFIRQLISEEKEGAPVYNMRMIEIKQGGHTPDHTHPYEHENFVVAGQGQVTIAGKDYDLKEGDVVFVPPNIRHQYRNTGPDTFRFLCSVPVEKLRPKI